MEQKLALLDHRNKMIAALPVGVLDQGASTATMEKLQQEGYPADEERRTLNA